MSISTRPDATAFKQYVCIICNHVYDEAAGDPSAGLPPGTRWASVPDNWVCPDCGVGKADFEEFD
jgi:rubredoxin